MSRPHGPSTASSRPARGLSIHCQMNPTATIDMTLGRKNTVRATARPRNHDALTATAIRNAPTTVRGTVPTAKRTVLRSASHNCGSRATADR